MRQLSVLALTLPVAGALLYWLQYSTPGYADLTGPIKAVGLQADAVDSNSFSARIVAARSSPRLAFTRYGKKIERDTDGIWLVLKVEVLAERETMLLGAASIKGASGRLYRQSERASGITGEISAQSLQPGLPKSALIVFELPRSETTQMTLVLSRNRSPRLDDEVSIIIVDQIIQEERIEIVDDDISS